MSDEKRKENLRKEDILGTEGIEGLQAFEAALSSLVPRADRLDRDRLMFLAGQQSSVGEMVGQAQRGPTNASSSTPYAEKPLGGTALRLSHPSLSRPTSWAWPAAFSAMTAVATVLAVLLATRPAVPVSNPTDSLLAAKANENQKEPTEHPQIQNTPADAIASENGFNREIKPAAPWIAFLQSLWNTTPAASDPSQIFYPQLRDRVLRNGLDAMQIAQTAPRDIPHRLPEPSTTRELLKEYLPELP